MSKSKRVIGPFDSKFGTVNPGDVIIFTGSSRGGSTTKYGRYIGYLLKKNQPAGGSWQTDPNGVKHWIPKFADKKIPQVASLRLKGFYKYKDTGQKIKDPYSAKNWPEVKKGELAGTIVYVQEHEPYISTLLNGRIIPSEKQNYAEGELLEKLKIWM